MEHYYLIQVTYKGIFRFRTGHIIMAVSEEEALRVSKKYGISYPMFSPHVCKREARKIDLKKEHERIRIKRRLREKGGCIWYETYFGIATIKLQK